MKRFFLSLSGLMIFLVSSCAGFPVSAGDGVSSAPERAGGIPPEERFWITPADGTGLVIIGASARRLNRDEALALALEDAARKVAVFNHVTGIIEHREIQQTGFMGFSSDTQSEIIVPPDYRAYVESMEYNLERDVLERDNAVFIRVRFPNIAGHRISSPLSRREGQPEWVLKPPSFPGFYTGVGHSGPYMNLRDTINASWESAVFSIVEAVSSTILLSQETVDEGIVSSMTDRFISARATLEGFYILETWIDPASKAVWTLGVARRPE